MDFWLSVVVLAAGIAVMMVFAARSVAKQREEIDAKTQEVIEKFPGFSPTFRQWGEDNKSGMIVDEHGGKVCFLRRDELMINHIMTGHQKLMSAELVEDGQTTIKTGRASQVGGVIVGGLLLGGVGAVIGGLSGKKVEKHKVRRIALRVVVDSATQPVHEICFLNDETEKGGEAYKAASNKGLQCQARIGALIKNGPKRKAPPKKLPESRPLQASVADELRKLAELKAAGVLTEAEFNAQKIKLLE